MSTTTSYILLAALLTAGVAFATVKRKLTLLASFTGVITALLLFAATGFVGVLLMTAFFIIGTTTTSHKKALKRSFESSGENSPRDARQVVANSGMAALLALAILLFPHYKYEFTLMIAAAFAAASGDTASSELGTVYGKNFYNIITLKKDARGLDGVISIEGTLSGLAASLLIACIYAIIFGWRWPVVIISLGGLAGNLADSLLGALLERKQRLGNNMVNFLATLTGAVAAWIMA